MSDQPPYEPPVETAEWPSAQPPERRYPAGWILLGLLFIFLISTALVRSLTREPAAKETTEESGFSTLLSISVSQRRFFDKAGMNKTAAEQSHQQAKDMLREPISTLVQKSRTDVDASRLYAAMRTERGDPVPSENLEPLRKSKNPHDQTLAKIYSAQKLTKPEAEALTRSLPDKPFEYRLAKVHALEKAGDQEARGREFTGNLAVATVFMVVVGLVVLFGSAVAWGIFLFTRRASKFEDAGFPMGPLSGADADRLAMRAFQIFIVFLLLSNLLPVFIKGPMASVLAGVGILVAIGVLSNVPVYGKRITVSSVGINTRNLGRNILWGIGGFLVELPIALTMALIGATLFKFLPAPSHPAAEQLKNVDQLLSALPILFMGSIIAPIWEEFVFRGLIFPGLSKVIGRVLPAAIVTGLVFAMIHPQGVAAWFALATIGAIGCALTYFTRSLIPAILMHLLNNSLIFCVMLAMTAKP